MGDTLVGFKPISQLLKYDASSLWYRPTCFQLKLTYFHVSYSMNKRRSTFTVQQ